MRWSSLWSRWPIENHTLPLTATLNVYADGLHETMRKFEIICIIHNGFRRNAKTTAFRRQILWSPEPVVYSSPSSRVCILLLWWTEIPLFSKRLFIRKCFKCKDSSDSPYIIMFARVSHRSTTRRILDFLPKTPSPKRHFSLGKLRRSTMQYWMFIFNA